MNRTAKDNLAITHKISNFIKSINFKLSTIIVLFFISYLVIYLWVDPSSQSLIAHDEGLYARRARLLEESNNWFAPPFEGAHHKTLGSYWLIALAIRIFGFSEISIRFPSYICSFISVLLVFLITRELSNKRAAFISVVSLISMPLWIQYSKYASPDMAFVTCTLICIYSLIKAFSAKTTNKFIYLFLSTFFLSIGFFLRSYMIFIPCIALSPYIFWTLKEEKLNSYLVLVSGLFVGFIPTLFNLYFAYRLHSSIGITSLFDFAKKQAIGPSIIKNLYLIPVNFIYFTFPVGLIIILLVIFTNPNNKISRPFLIYGYPLISIIILFSMSNSYSHYFLFLLPTLAIYFSIYIESFTYKYSYSFKSIKYVLLFVLIIIMITVFSSTFIYKYHLLNLTKEQLYYSLILGSIFILSYLFAIKHILFRSINNNLIKLLMIITLPQFFGVSLLYNFGIVGNPNTTLKKFISSKSFKEISNKNKIYLIDLNSKTKTLLSYYLPSSESIDSLKSLPDYSFLITSNFNISSELIKSNNYKLINSFGNNYLFSHNIHLSH